RGEPAAGIRISWSVPPNGREEYVAEIFGFTRADAFDPVQLRYARGPQPGQLAKRGVMKDHVRRDAARASDLQPDGAQPFEQIAIDVLPGFRFDARSLR